MSMELIRETDEIPEPPRTPSELDASPSSLGEAVMRQLRERSSNPPPMVDARSLKLRASHRPIDGSAPSPSPSTLLEARRPTDVDTIYDARLTPSEPAVDAAAMEDVEVPSVPSGRVDRETPKTPMTSVATKENDLRSIPMKKDRRWLSMFGLMTLGLAIAGGWHLRSGHPTARAPLAVAAAEPTLEDLGIPPPPAETILTSAPIETAADTHADPAMPVSTPVTRSNESDAKVATTQAGDAGVHTAP
jgi:hypothetical protein